MRQAPTAPNGLRGGNGLELLKYRFLFYEIYTRFQKLPLNTTQ